jgi:hypothetical protein
MSGDPQSAIFDAELLPLAAQRTVSAAAIEDAGGLRVEEIGILVSAFGVPVPAPQEPAYTPEEADTLTELGGLRDVWPPELALQLARVYGRHVSRIAQTTVQLFRVYVEQPLRAEHDDPQAGLRAVQAAFEHLQPLAEPLMLGVYRRWVEHELG